MVGLALITSICGVASATTYYVATNGSNSWPGSSSQPWATIQYAVDNTVAGDTIIVRNGTYAGARIENSGTSGSPKTLMAENVGGVLLNSLSPTARHSGVLEVENYNAAVSYWVIDGFVIDGVNHTYRCFDSRNTETQQNSHITFTNSECYQALATGIFAAFTNYVLIENNVSHDNGEHGIYVNNSSDNGVVRGNESYGSVSNGIHMNGDASMGGDGELSNWLVEDNVCHNNPATGINCDGVDQSTFRNNLIYEFGSKGITMYAIDGAVASNNNRILNNTVLSDSGGLIGYYDYFSNGSRRDPAVNNKVFNNILYNYRTATNRGSICIATYDEQGFESDYNVVMEYFGLNDNKTVLNFAQWQARGYDLHSIQAADTALFTDPANHVYTLKTGSPAIDHGTTLTDVTDDILGVSRPQGSAYDMGCYEAAGGPPPDLVITTTSLPDGTVGVAYSQTLQATGGVTPYTWSVVSGSLPAGLSLGSSTGTVSGTPTATGTSNFTVQVADSQQPADTDTQALSITTVAAPPAPTITTTSLPSGTRGTPYSATVQATGGTLPYTWSIVSGSLPTGLSLNPSTGVISGTPTKKGTKSFTIRCTDAMSQYDDQALSITIN